MPSHCISVRQNLLKCLKVRSITFGTVTNCNKSVLHNSLEKNFTYTHVLYMANMRKYTNKVKQHIQNDKFCTFYV